MWDRKAIIEHRNSEGLHGFLRLHFRYGQGVFLYKSQQLQRGSGTMKEDVRFHASVLSRIFKKLISRPPLGSLSLLLLFGLRQATNALGFAFAWLGETRVRSGRANPST
jgi:hypothetical protein